MWVKQRRRTGSDREVAPCEDRRSGREFVYNAEEDVSREWGIVGDALRLKG